MIYTFQRGGYEEEARQEARAVEHDMKHPRPVGDILTEEDLIEWIKQKEQYARETAKRP